MNIFNNDRGMFVWVAKKATKKGMSPKLDMKWQGPYLVIDKLSEVVFRIQQSGPRGPKKVVHYDLLKLYHGKPLESWLHKIRQVEKRQEPPSLTLSVQSSPSTQRADPTLLPRNEHPKVPCSSRLENSSRRPAEQEPRPTKKDDDSDLQTNRYPQRHRNPPDRYAMHDYAEDYQVRPIGTMLRFYARVTIMTHMQRLMTRKINLDWLA